MVSFHSLLTAGVGSFTEGTIPRSCPYSVLPDLCHAPLSMGPSPSARPFGPSSVVAPGNAPPPFVLTALVSTVPHSDSWQRLGSNFARAYIHTYLQAAIGRCLSSPLPALSCAGATPSRPYLPLGPYQLSLGHVCLFPTVSPAPTVVRRGGTNCLRLHSAGSTLPQLGPTGSSLGQLPLSTTRWFSANPSDLPSRGAPCPPKDYQRWLQVHPGCVQLSPSCPGRLLPTFLYFRPVRHYPHLWISTRGRGSSGTLTRLKHTLPGTHYDPS